MSKAEPDVSSPLDVDPKSIYSVLHVEGYVLLSPLPAAIDIVYCVAVAGMAETANAVDIPLPVNPVPTFSALKAFEVPFEFQNVFDAPVPSAVTAVSCPSALYVIDPLPSAEVPAVIPVVAMFTVGVVAPPVIEIPVPAFTEVTGAVPEEAEVSWP